MRLLLLRPCRYRYNFEFVPHPKIKANTKSGRYFVKYRRNDNIRQYVTKNAMRGAVLVADR